jgi:hypothetical protein
VYILFEVSKKFRDTFVVQVKDNDGPFLLIEAAELLPKWLEGMSFEDAESRVFLWQGAVHLVSRVIKANPRLSPEEALEAVQSTTLLTVASASIQERILGKIAKFPSCLARPSFESGLARRTFYHHHHMHMYIPHRLAFILNRLPTLTSLLVDCLAANGDHLPKFTEAISLSIHEKNFVKSCVRLTKLQYTMLATMESLAGCLSRELRHDKDERELVAYDFGMKLVLGFHLFLQKAPDYFPKAPANGNVALDVDLVETFRQEYSVPKEAAICPSRIMQRFPVTLAELDDVTTICPLPQLPTELSSEDALDWLDDEPSEPESVQGSVEAPLAERDATKKARREPVGSKEPEATLEEMTGLFEHLLSKESDYRGISLEDTPLSSASEEVYASDDEKENDADRVEETDEIFETLLHDPDLLMKLVEKCYHHDVDPRELVDRLREFRSTTLALNGDLVDRVESPEENNGTNQEAVSSGDDGDLLWGGPREAFLSEETAYHRYVASSSDED